MVDAVFRLAICKFVVIEHVFVCVFFFFQAEDGIRDYKVTGVQTCALPISQALADVQERAAWAAASACVLHAEGRHAEAVGLGERTIELGETLGIDGQDAKRSEERRGGEECRSRWSPDH